MRILMGAQNCGFGPAAELVAVSRLLPGHQRVFVGDGVAAIFARRHPDAFDEIHEDPAAIDRLLAGCDQVVSVMDADLVLRAVVAGRRVTMVDSLFGFWQLTRPLPRIRDLCADLPRTSFAAATHHLGGLTPHERVIAAHLLATHCLVQSFPGVAERMAAFTALGDAGPKLHLTGSLVDLEGLRKAPRDAEPDCDLLINIGGFQNFLLDFETNNDYLHLLRRWLPDLLRDWPRFPRVLLCGGPFAGHRERTVTAAGRQVVCRFLPQRELLRKVAATPHYLLTPGLTALHESLALGRMPLALHEQHYAHLFTVRQLDGTLFGRTAGRFADVLPDHPVPEDDFAGTQALMEIAGRIREDDALYARFRRSINGRIEQYVSLTPAQHRGGVGELRTLLDGDPLPEVLARTIPRSHGRHLP
ncbi:hypothetical protein [Streptomyces sp. 1331.2]|uniref:hypothetical protein n=1 Tax=Streptomyces sp. 1331.2 TaxID=1938835 RepID=UPI000BC6597B|nr:hypothetical protein [Streptomyces sp. 1331.2]SOB88444.1 hypothetical protein SAMN06272789_6725 [Streptomyces sp. 1331.2]